MDKEREREKEREKERRKERKKGRKEGTKNERKRKKEKVKSLSHIRLFANPWTNVAHQVPLSIGFSSRLETVP